jgi:hypothetical protein
MSKKIHVFVILFLLIWIGCRKTPDDDPGDRDSKQIPFSEVERLRSLGYLDYSASKATEKQGGVITFDEAHSYPGYNLYSIRILCRADLIDMRGSVIRSWHAPGSFWSNCIMLSNGDLLAIGAEPGATRLTDIEDDTRYIMRFSWNGDLIWKRHIPAHHDIELTPHNTLLVLTMNNRRIPAIHSEIDIRDNKLTLLSLDGEVLEECSFYDALTADPRIFTLQHLNRKVREDQKIIDLFHSNSVEWIHHPRLAKKHPLYSDGNILVCMRHQDSIAIINWDAKRVVWSWGQGHLSGPHDATVLENGSILLFDNGIARRWSRVIELDPLKKEIVWQYNAPDPTDFYTLGRGSSQRLPNGNTLIANSDSGQVFEVTPEGRIVWEFLTPFMNEKKHRATIVRMKRYETSFIDKMINRFEKNDAHE